MEPYYVQHIQESAQWISDRIDRRPLDIGLVLGSGLGDMAAQVEDAVTIPYDRIPHFPVSTVEGHAGQFVIGKLEGKSVIVMQGRFHYYEGYSMKKVVFPIYVMKQLGVRSLVITNAAGGMNKGFQAGDLMLISDHLNMTGDNPLIGINRPELGPRFPDMSQAYSREYRVLAKRIAERMGQEREEMVRLQEGVYAGISGPNYLPPAELTMLAQLGGDAIGMSTVGEVIAASHTGLKVLGISCITDMAIGEELEPLTHEQVVAVANRTKPVFIELVKQFVREVTV
ncbi:MULTISPECIES: purine-nucleoside phosphorylase [unclassified Paenibacillus]|uniref:purine-nucleoside phosphorylase n=1 Tax=unclassified Paenibacillus TaxID=185978 RepID=UPI001AE8B86D|nr:MULTISPECIES: purine-nucleoside phosphorylase [unclassified Paenibacillus]MBP1155175.1 purine-nucleoside phosphorylase [Paenibacillus sp. PvP091]MBP1169441.1 purine-nucleoside phosphorylase [Paenibacillus sp. PvR098]MBP2440469.1 purine-nucleoside phosphorylase [Paenibacillus sp. PvP052]